MIYKYVLISLLIIIGLANLIINKCKIAKYSSHIDATVIDIIKKEDIQGHYHYFPVFKFVISNEPIALESKQGFNPSPYQVDDKAILMYKPGDEGSQKFICNKDKSYTWLSIVLFIAAILIFTMWG